mmetsp:Transcript_17852/g.35978  ORF Transcript_17852/g.35978 Transcript_17852/m.35978 type:complete len:81 (-) Transcript_17852:837-1079(-)
MTSWSRPSSRKCNTCTVHSGLREAVATAFKNEAMPNFLNAINLKSLQGGRIESYNDMKNVAFHRGDNGILYQNILEISTR